MVPTSCPVTAQVKAEVEVKVAKSAQDKTSLEGATCAAAHTVGPPMPADASWNRVCAGECEASCPVLFSSVAGPASGALLSSSPGC